jgi:hypothetical protein
MLHLIAMYTNKVVQAVVSYVYIVILSYHSDREQTQQPGRYKASAISLT